MSADLLPHALPIPRYDGGSFKETDLIVAGALAAKNRCNADCSSVAAIDSVDSFFVAKDTGCAPVTFGHKNESTDPKSAQLSTLPLPPN